MTTATAALETAMTVEITRGETYTHVVPGTYNSGLERSESFPIAELHIGDELVGVVVYAGTKDEEVCDPCRRCVLGGHYSFNGHDSICYACHGEGHGKLTDEASIIRRYLARQKAAAKRERLAREAEERAAAELAAWINANTDLWMDLKGFLPKKEWDDYSGAQYRLPATSFLAKLAVQVYDDLKPLSEKQTAAAKDAVTKTQARNEERVAAGHWGTVGKRDKVVVDVVSCKDFDSQWGTTWLVTMKTTEGHVLKSWASGAFVFDALNALDNKKCEGHESLAGEHMGETVECNGKCRPKDAARLTIKATVKAHGEYNGLPETTVTRVTSLG